MANIVMVVVLLQPTVLMAKKTAYNDDKRYFIDRYESRDAKAWRNMLANS